MKRRTQLRRRMPLQRGAPPVSRTPLRRRMPLVYRGRRQPVKNPWPMTATPEFYDEMMEQRGYRCDRSLAVGVIHEPDLSLSRIVPGSKGGPYTWWNVFVLCGDGTRGCHGWVEDNPLAAEREGWRAPGRFVRGVYVGGADWYRRRYQAVRGQML